ncbi:hypothetical protein [uncultured Roseibium sp.]|uniref:hypothetical protein n=1 Tax=uncultured Roseibium sp. TaxID=1936171 RepID=UPI00321671E3
MPSFELFKILGLSGTWLLVSAAILAFFWNLDSAISEEFRQDIAKKITDKDYEKNSNNTHSIIEYINIVSGKRDSKLKQYIFSVSLFLTSYALITIIISFTMFSPLAYLEISFYSFIITGIFLSLTSSYLSILQTNFIISYTKGRFSDLLLFLLDIFLKAIIVLLCFLGSVMPWYFILGDNAELPFQRYYELTGYLSMNGRYGPNFYAFSSLLPSFLSSYAISLFIWPYILVVITINKKYLPRSIIKKAAYILPIKEKPLRSIGELLFLGWTFSYIFFFFIGEYIQKYVEEWDRYWIIFWQY